MKKIKVLGKVVGMYNERTHVLRKRVYKSKHFFRVEQNVKRGKSLILLGCSIDFFKNHIEKQFEPGMTWENRAPNGWHIDHIKPLEKFDLTNENQIKEAFNFKNTRPLWARENCLRTRNI